MPTLDGKVAIVTGAAVGLGRAFAEALAREGAAVALCDVRPELTITATALADAGHQVYSAHTDVSRPDHVRRFVDATVERFGGIDILVNNAGTWRATYCDDPWEKGLDDWDAIMGTNLKGVFLFGRAVIPHLIARGAGGNIVNIATDHIHPPPGFATGGGTRMDIYDSSKWGINGLTIDWAHALEKHRIRCNALCMDATDSMMIRSAMGRPPSEELLKRWMRPEQTARLLLDLLAEGPDGRTGENIGLWVGHEVKLPSRQTPLPRRFA